MAQRKPGPVRPRVKDEKAFERALRTAYLNPVRNIFRDRLALAEAVNQAWQAADGALADIDARPRKGVPVRLVREHLARINGYHRARLIKTFQSALGVDVSPLLIESAVLRFMEGRIAESVDLVSTIPGRLHASLRASITREFLEAPFDQERLMRMFAKEFKSAGYNLRRITRDQTNKAIGGLTEIRQTQLGVEQYEWLTAGDERVRRSHEANNGVTFSWADPPVDTSHPGFDVMCRCTALPVMPQATVDRLKQVPGRPDSAPVRPPSAIPSPPGRGGRLTPAEQAETNRVLRTAKQEAKENEMSGVYANKAKMQGSGDFDTLGQVQTAPDETLVYHGTYRDDWVPHKATHFTDSLSAAENYSRAGFHDDGFVNVMKVKNSYLNRSVDLIPDSLSDTDVGDDIEAFLRLFPEARASDLAAYRDTTLGGQGLTMRTYKVLTDEAAENFAVVDRFPNGRYVVDDDGLAVAHFRYKQGQQLADDALEELLDGDGYVADAVDWYEQGGKWRADMAPEWVPAHQRRIPTAKPDPPAAVEAVGEKWAPGAGQSKYGDQPDASADNPFIDYWQMLRSRKGPGDPKVAAQRAKVEQWELDQRR